jgi:hypothetical protein
MMKWKLLTVVLSVLGAGAVVLAAEVINIDLNGYNDNRPYVGNGAYDVGNNTVWTVYYGGWGVPVGSKRTEALVGSGVPLNQQFYSSVYAAQVWLGDKGQHWYKWGSALMDDGFDVNLVPEPNIAIFGEGAYQGVYDIYVYGSEAGTFKLKRYGTTTTKQVAGDANAGQFELGHNYVVFDNVDINNPNPDDIYLTYTNVINGLQLVKQKDPCAIEPNSLGLIRIPAGDWDVAGDRNTRLDESNPQGPDTFFDDVNGIGRLVGYLDIPEFMGYDITVDEANEGQYEISIGVRGDSIGIPPGGNSGGGGMRIYLDDIFIGDVNLLTAPPAGTTGETTKVKANLYEGSHTIKWVLAAGNTGANIVDVNFVKLGNAVIANCADVVHYGFALTEDLNGDCKVDFRDLKMAVEDWVQCNNPDPSLCF